MHAIATIAHMAYEVPMFLSIPGGPWGTKCPNEVEVILGVNDLRVFCVCDAQLSSANTFRICATNSSVTRERRGGINGQPLRCFTIAVAMLF